MTNEEAINCVKRIRYYMEGGECWTDAEFIAMDMAIKALEQSEPCEDTISRQATINVIKKRLFETAFNNVGIKQNIDETLVDVAENRLENWFDELPSVQLGTNLAEVGTDLATRRTVKGFPIDADLLMLKAEEIYGCRTRDRLYEIIRFMPKYEYPERKKGTWTKDASCPFCGFKPWYERDIHTLSFCPNCGADMRGEKNG